jgi:hypothetical protein
MDELFASDILVVLCFYAELIRSTMMFLDLVGARLALVSGLVVARIEFVVPAMGALGDLLAFGHMGLLVTLGAAEIAGLFCRFACMGCHG